MTPVAEALHLRAQVDGRRSDLAFTTATGDLFRLADAGARPSRSRRSRHRPSRACGRPTRATPPTSSWAPTSGRSCSTRWRRSWRQGGAPTSARSRPPICLTRLGPPELVELVGAGHRRDGARDDARPRGAAPAAPRPVPPGPGHARRSWTRRAGCATSRSIGLDQPLVEGASVAVPLGSVTARPRPSTDRCSTLLAERPITVADLLSIHPGLSFSDAIGSMALLVGGGYVAPEIPGWRDGPHRRADPSAQRGADRREPPRRRPRQPDLPRHGRRDRLGVRRDAHGRSGLVGHRARPERADRPRARRAAPPAPPRAGGRRAGERRGRQPATSCTAGPTALERIDGLFTAHGIC